MDKGIRMAMMRPYAHHTVWWPHGVQHTAFKNQAASLFLLKFSDRAAFWVYH